MRRISMQRIRAPRARPFRLPLLAAALVLGAALLLACTPEDTGEPETLGERVIASLQRDDAVLYMRWTFEEAPGAPAEEAELWVDWAAQAARYERRDPRRPAHTRVIVDGVEYDGRDARRPLADHFTFEALPPSVHLFQMLSADDDTFIGPRIEQRADGGVETVEWAIEYPDGPHGCIEIRGRMLAATAHPIASWAAPCDASPDGAERVSLTTYQRIEFLDRDSLPADFFAPPSQDHGATRPPLSTWPRGGGQGEGRRCSLTPAEPSEPLSPERGQG